MTRSLDRGRRRRATPIADIPQPYGELFIMGADGWEQRALTDNRWEEGTLAWVA